MKKWLLLIPFLFVGCERTKKESPLADISAFQLCRTYRDLPDVASKAYSGSKVRLRFMPGEAQFVTGNGDVPSGYCWFFPGEKNPALICVVDKEPVVRSNVEIIGTCRGIVRDGNRRGPGIDWYLVISECSFNTDH